jgi:hypothetical protein
MATQDMNGDGGLAGRPLKPSAKEKEATAENENIL